MEHIWKVNATRAVGHSTEVVDGVRTVEGRGVVEHKGSQSKEVGEPARVDRMP